MLGIRWLEIAAIDCSSELVSIKIVSVSAASIRVSTDSLIFVSRIFGSEWCGKHEYRNHQSTLRRTIKKTHQAGKHLEQDGRVAVVDDAASAHVS